MTRAITDDVQSSDVTDKIHRIKRIAIDGGFLKGAVFELPDNLSCIIGGRGAGKSTILEMVRHAMNAYDGCSQKYREQTESLVRDNLGDGKVVLTIETSSGLEHTISRTADGPPVVVTNNGHATEAELCAADLLCASVYSQNQIESIASDPASQLSLIDGFDREGIARINARIQPVARELEKDLAEIMGVNGQICELAQHLEELGAIEQRLKTFSRRGTKSGDAIETAFEQKSERASEKLALDQTATSLNEVAEELSELLGIVGRNAGSDLQKEIKGPNPELMQKVSDVVLQCGQQVDQSLQDALAAIKRHGKALGRLQCRLSKLHGSQELDFAKVLEKYNQAKKEAEERANYQRRYEELLLQRRRHDQLQNRLKQLLEHRAGFLGQLKKLRHERYVLRSRITQQINEELGSDLLRVRMEENGNVRPLREVLEEALRIADKHFPRYVVAKKLAERMQPAEIAAAVIQHDSSKLVHVADINENQAQVVLDRLAHSPDLLALESLEMLDLPRIELKDGRIYKDSLKLSPGQKCTAILPILLLASRNPLLIDQPEDNLDNSFVYDTIVQTLKNAKRRRQIILVTHNANIPVLGYAERMFVLYSNGENSRIACQGGFEECREYCMKYLEGGKRAFDERGERYRDDAA